MSAAHLIVHDESMKDESLVFHKEVANKFLVEAREKAAELGITRYLYHHYLMLVTTLRPLLKRKTVTANV